MTKKITVVVKTGAAIVRREIDTNATKITIRITRTSK